MRSPLFSRRSLALATSVALAATTFLLAPPPAAIAAPTEAGLVAWYPLSQTSGTTVEDASGNGKTATVEGASTWNDGLGFRFSGGSNSSGNAIKLPNNLMAGLNSITVSFDAWVDPALTGQHFIYNLGNTAVGTPQSGTGYLFSSATPYLAKASSAAWSAEQVTSSGKNLARGVWKRLSYTQTGTTGVLYEDGVAVAQNTAVTTTPGSIGGGVTTRNFIGRSAYAADTSFKGIVRDFRVYNRALDKTEITSLIGDSRAPIVAADALWVTTALGDTSALTRSVTLPTVGPGGSTISWSSSAPEVISDTGVLTRGALDRRVSLTATVGIGGSVQTRVIEATVLGDADPVQTALNEAASALSVHGVEDVRGNITLPATSATAAVLWHSSHPKIISATGIVARPATGEPTAAVTLTATLTIAEQSLVRTFEASVPALPKTEKTEAYLFSYFEGDSVPGEKIYFGASNGNNARDWITLAGGKPLFTSTEGTKGLRDPFIIRSPEGDRFYMIATDLSIGTNGNWTQAQTHGSQYLEIWESTDLVNWSEQRHVKVSPSNAGNTWAPEAYYDQSLGEYVVFWASKLYPEDDVHHTTGQANRMMYATTRDFHTFSEAKVWQSTAKSRIDSTVIEEDGTYYRFTKDEGSEHGCLDIFMETSTSLTAITTPGSSDWTMRDTCIGKKAGTGAVEGPTVFKANPGDVNGEGYYLFVDEFSGRKYIPLFSQSLKNPSWSIPSSFTLPTPAPRHGTVLPVTAAEYERVMAKYLAAPTSVAPVQRTTTVGTPATLPRTVAVTLADKSVQNLAVTWDTAALGDYAAQAGTVTATGTIAGITLRAEATITVLDSSTTKNTLLEYDFSQRSGNTVTDLSGHGNNGIIRGSGASVTDNVLTLPGGSSSSGAGYLEIPRGTFDGQDTLTISTWLRNETGNGNYAAMFFGAAANPPTNYWLLNPRNASGRFKTVITNSVSASSPWVTEYGISPTNAGQGVNGPATGSDWALYTTVIKPGSITGYLNGTSVGTVATTRTVSDFGSDLVSYIGRSSYADPYYKGGVRDVSVRTVAASASSIRAEYLAGVGDTSVIDRALSSDLSAISLGSDRVTGDLTLPTEGAQGSTLTWSSSDPSRIGADGTVNRPLLFNADVTLTATATIGGRTQSKEFKLTVLAATAQNDVSVAAEGFDLGITHVSSALTLPTTLGEVGVSWSSSAPGAIAADGSITRGAQAASVILTATFTKDLARTTREYPVTVLAEETGTVGAYRKSGGTAHTDVLHVALGRDGTLSTVGNARAILYPTLGTVRLGNTDIVRTPTGGFTVVAPAVGAPNQLFVFDSTDLVSFTNERLVSLPGGLTTDKVAVTYDHSIRGYRIEFTATGDGVRYLVTTTDFKSFSEAKPAPAGKLTTLVAALAAEVSFPEGTIAGGTIGLTETEYQRIAAKLGRVTHTGVQDFADVPVAAKATVPTLPATATLNYSSGSTSSFPVAWDQSGLSSIDTTVPGTYTVTGTIERPDYGDVLVERRADPDVTLGDDGWYYFTGSYPTTSNSDPEGYDRIILRRAQTIAGLATAAEVTIWDEANDPTLNRYIWAPELQKIGDDWYVLFTAARGGGVWDIRPVMLKFTGSEFTGDQVMDSKNWTSLGQVKAAPGDTAAFTSFSLDMTAFEHRGRHYVIWAEKPGASVLRMGEIDPKDPTQLISASILLSEPTQAWERNNGQQVDEGPAVIKNGDHVYIAFSASTVDDKYAVGLLAASEDADLMKPASWKKTGYPLLTTADVPGQVGPGHNSFTTDAWGNPVIVFHSRTVGDTSNPGEATDLGLNDPRRHARAKTVHFDLDGEPVFNMTPAEELNPELARVQVRVVVAAEPGAGVDADSAADAGAGAGADANAEAGADANAGAHAAAEAGADAETGAAANAETGADANAGAHAAAESAAATRADADSDAGAGAAASADAGSTSSGSAQAGTAGNAGASGTDSGAGTTGNSGSNGAPGTATSTANAASGSTGSGTSSGTPATPDASDPTTGGLPSSGGNLGWILPVAFALVIGGLVISLVRRSRQTR